MIIRQCNILTFRKRSMSFKILLELKEKSIFYILFYLAFEMLIQNAHTIL